MDEAPPLENQVVTTLLCLEAPLRCLAATPQDAWVLVVLKYIDIIVLPRPSFVLIRSRSPLETEMLSTQGM